MFRTLRNLSFEQKHLQQSWRKLGTDKMSFRKVVSNDIITYKKENKMCLFLLYKHLRV